MDILIRCAGFTIELLKSLLFMKLIIGYQFKKSAIRFVPILAALSCLFIYILLLTHSSGLLIDLVDKIGILIIVLISFRGKTVKVGSVFIISYLMICVVDLIIFFVLSRIPALSAVLSVENELSMRLSDSISLIILMVISQLNERKRIKIPLRSLHWSHYVLILWFLICSSFLLVYIQIIENESNAKLSYFLTIILITTFVGIISIVILMTRANHNSQKYKALFIMNQKHIEIQEQYYRLMSEKNEEIKRFRHDVINHLLCMRELARKDSHQELYQYINDLTDEFQEISYSIHTGCSVVDAIINDALVKYGEVNINVNGVLPNPLYISAVDLCILFSNMISNAIEAMDRIDESENISNTIDIHIKNLNSNIYIKATNPIINTVVIENNSVATTKKDKDRHGYGLGNIRKCARKYHGTVELSSTQNEFIIEIIMKNIKRPLPTCF